VALTGGLSQDVGLLAALRELAAAEEATAETPACDFVAHPDGIYAGALGAAIWADFRAARMEERRVA
jgi:benzoyl-CoA reductase subunit D